jgi:hypothetical protein
MDHNDALAATNDRLFNDIGAIRSEAGQNAPCHRQGRIEVVPRSGTIFGDGQVENPSALLAVLCLASHQDIGASTDRHIQKLDVHFYNRNAACQGPNDAQVSEWVRGVIKNFGRQHRRRRDMLRAMKVCSGDVIVIQDADLEKTPSD